MPHIIAGHTIRVGAVLAALVLAGGTSARAQVTGRAYVEGGLAIPTQSGATGTESVIYVTAPGGTTLGWLVGAGVGLGREATAFGEWSTTGWMTAIEPSRYDITYQERRRDRFLLAGLRAELHLGSAAVLEPMAALAFTFPEATSQATYPDLPRPDQPRVTHALDTAVGPAFGVGLRLGAARLTVVPSFTVIRSKVSGGRYDDTSGSPRTEVEAIYPGGYPEWTWRPAIAARLGF